MNRRKKNLQPWIDYFEMLHEYELKGYLEVQPAMHEAYVTLPALCTLSTDRDDTAATVETAKNQVKAARRIRAYAGWKSQEGASYLAGSFALHVVGDAAPHDLIYTLLMTRRRRWWKPWRKSDCLELIDYTEKDGKP